MTREEAEKIAAEAKGMAEADAYEAAAGAMLAALEGIQAWATMMGGWESEKWTAVDAAIAAARAAGITTDGELKGERGNVDDSRRKP
jgi:hypothetical protein